MTFRKTQYVLALAIAAGLTLSTNVHADVVYITGDATTSSVALGINDAGHLNYSPGIVVNGGFLTIPSDPHDTTGLAFKFPTAVGYLPAGAWADGTSPGCFCEGWGVSAKDSAGISYSGYADAQLGPPVNLVVDSFATGGSGPDPSTATSMVHLANLPGLKVTQEYQPSTNAPLVLFRNHVTIMNQTDDTLTEVRFVRAMDWDIPPTEFAEHVTIQGVGASKLEESHNNGFTIPDPLGASFPLDPATLNVNFVDHVDPISLLPTDDGAYFRFNFGAIGAGKSYEFDIYYGAAGTEAAADAARLAEGVFLYSYGQENLPFHGIAQICSPDPFPPHDLVCGPQEVDVPGFGDPALGSPATYIFGFKGVGEVPEPATWLLLAAGCAGLVTLSGRRRL